MVKNLQSLTMKDLMEIRKEIYGKDYFFSVSFESMGKHFLKYFSGFDNIFSMPFDHTRNQFISLFGDSNDEVPDSENGFFRFICFKYLDLEREPCQCLLTLYILTSDNIKEIRENIAYCEQEIERLEREKRSDQEKTLAEEGVNYKIEVHRHYINLNELAEKETVEFLSSDNIYKAAHLNARIDRLGINNTFLDTLLYSFECNPEKYDVKLHSDISNKFLELKVKEHRKIEILYQEDERGDFHRFMRDYIQTHEIYDKTLALIDKSHHLNERKHILTPAIEHYKRGNKTEFLYIAILQIEGIFEDYCTALGVSEEKMSKESIAGKLDRIIKLNKGFYSFEYFKFVFPITRNKIAHGKNMKVQDIEFFSDFILLDLFDVSGRIVSDDLPLNELLSCMRQAHELNDISSLVKFAFAVSKKPDDLIPVFYCKETIVNELKSRLRYADFTEYLSKLLALKNGAITAGIEVILNYLKGESILSKEKCDPFFKNIQGQKKEANKKQVSVSKIDFAKFCGEIDNNAAQIN